MSGSEQQQEHQEHQEQPTFTFKHLAMVREYLDTRQEPEQLESSDEILIEKAKRVMKVLEHYKTQVGELNEKNMPMHPCLVCSNKVKVLSKLDCCDHGFCFHCIDEWTESNTSCPVCQRKIQKIHYVNDGKNGTKYIGYFQFKSRRHNDWID